VEQGIASALHVIRMPCGTPMLKFLRKSKLYLFAIPFLLWTLGAGMNQIAINANHDSMPVLYNAGNVRAFVHVDEGYPIESQGEMLTDGIHSVLTSESRFYILCDIIDFHNVKYSLGDGVLFASRWLESVIPYVWGLALYAEVRKKEE
jgi:hypothetical protein